MSLVDEKETLLIVTADHSHGYGVIGYATRNMSVLDVDNTAKVSTKSIVICIICSNVTHIHCNYTHDNRQS